MSALHARVRRLELGGRDSEPVLALLVRGKSRRAENEALLAEAERMAAERNVQLIIVSLPPGPPPGPPQGMDLGLHLDPPRAPKMPPAPTVPPSGLH